MTFYANIGYKFKLPGGVITDGSVVLASAMPMHQLERRKFDTRYPHMENRLFDPQLYLSNINPVTAQKACSNLASYPWFGVVNIPLYDSALFSQTEWSTQVMSDIVNLWPRTTPTDPEIIRSGLQECIDFQIRCGVQAIILPSPLTTDPATSYDEEIFWLDEGIRIAQENQVELPIFASVALSDLCMRFEQPLNNRFLELIADSISAREIDGVYLILEQALEPAETRQCGDSRTLQSMLTLVHYLSRDAGLKVIVNFMGAFGLALEAAGAEIWASGWYKSLYRLRIADYSATGRAYPTYWSYPAVLDIHMEAEFDRLVANGQLEIISDVTPASQGLLNAAEQGIPSTQVPTWTYRQSNVASAQEHFYRSVIQADNILSTLRGVAKIDFVNEWLDQALNNAGVIAQSIGGQIRTKVQHVNAWHQAFAAYRTDHRV